MDSMGTMLKNGADFVTVGGTWSKGRAEIVKQHKKNH